MPGSPITLRRLLGGLRRRVAPPRILPRSQYKAVWNAQSRTEDAAKIAVAGYTEEAEFERAAQATAAKLERRVGLHASDVILEIGAGVGRVGAALAPRCRQWIGADVSPHMVQHMQRRLAALPNAAAIEISGYDLAPVASGTIDLAYCTVVFMHLDEWDRFNYVAEAMRVLRPGGRLLIDNFNLCSDEGWAMFEELRRLPPTQRPAHISKSSTPQELLEYLRRAGFTKIDHAEEGLWVTAWGHKP